MAVADDIPRYFSGAWRLMMGKPDGVRLLDVSADGFWNSFFAIPVAIPPLAVGWTGLALDLASKGRGSRLSLFASLAAMDILAWILPIVALGLIARPAGIADRYAHFVVATNWASALLAWLMLPVAILAVFNPGPAVIDDVASLVAFVLALVLTWRLTNAVLAKGPALATALFVGMVLSTFALLAFLQNLFGLQGAQVPAG